MRLETQQGGIPRASKKPRAFPEQGTECSHQICALETDPQPPVSLWSTLWRDLSWLTWEGFRMDMRSELGLDQAMDWQGR